LIFYLSENDKVPVPAMVFLLVPTRVYFNVQFYTKCAVLNPFVQFLKKMCNFGIGNRTSTCIWDLSFVAFFLALFIQWISYINGVWKVDHAMKHCIL
jgi:hypothetical protein